MNTNENQSPPNPACERVRGRLELLTDGALLPLEEALDRGHLEACAGCAEEAASWSSFHGLLGAAFPADGALDAALFEGLEERLAQVVIQRPEAHAARSRMLTSLAGAAASLLVLFSLEALGAVMNQGESAGTPFLLPHATPAPDVGEPFLRLFEYLPNIIPSDLLGTSDGDSQ